MESISSKKSLVALLGRQDEPTDGVEDYCTWLGRALAGIGFQLKPMRVAWAERGWLAALVWLWRESVRWQGQWVLAQYTALSWSRRGFPIGFLAVLLLLSQRRVRCAIVFHDAEGYGGERLIDRMRRGCQQWVMRTAYRWAKRSILTIPLELVSWLPPNPAKADFIPVGANIPECGKKPETDDLRQRDGKTVAVFGVTGGVQIPREVQQIASAVTRAAKQVPQLRLVVLGRGSEEASEPLRRALQDTGVELSVLGLLSSEEIARVLSGADVLLFVRGHVSSRRGSAIAGIACGLPIVGYAGPETGFPITEAGVELVAQGNLEGLAEVLARVLVDEGLRKELQQRSLRAQVNHFSWDVIADRYTEVLRDG